MLPTNILNVKMNLYVRNPHSDRAEKLGKIETTNNVIIEDGCC